MTGATGNVGRAVARHLLEAGESVVSAVRDPSDPNVVSGTDVRVCNFEEPTGWATAFSGVDRLFLLRPPPISDVQKYLFPVIDRALECGVKQIVFLSLQGVQFNTATPHHAVETYLKARNAPFTLLRPNFFMQNLSTTYRDDIRDRGEIFVPAGSARTAFIDTDDIGRVAAFVLTEPGHIGKAYTLSGEQSLSYFTVAKLLTAELGYEVRYAEPTVADYVKRLQNDGAAADYIDVQKMIYKVVRANASAFPNRTIRKITGRPATSFSEFAHRERDAWARPTTPLAP
ncbi:MAG: SDR family oxidoreductase [Microbacteriaceae bacterium]|nr:SDR family oxidoreductase [Microbacteriaceae bacterium]